MQVPPRDSIQRSDRPVLVLPGLGATDTSTIVLRRAIARRGHPTSRWRLGRNLGPTDEVQAGLLHRLRTINARNDRPVAIVGWSLGGIYALRLAQLSPELVSAVITLGSPLRSALRSTATPGIPVTSIWTRNDSIVPWQDSVLPVGPLSENIEVDSSHLRLGFDRQPLRAVVDRLGQDPKRWRPYSASARVRATPSSA